ncbi:MAG TPA: cysteine synthase family protein [Pyrinomonadaceae bacterium]|nr:cysteine synthase family protein [Pyrinomonadaceae bacterium]
MEKTVLETEKNLEVHTETIAESFLEASIGNTPLIRLRRIPRDLPAGIEIYAKAEHLNPGGSVKDRAALAMIFAGEQSGQLTKGKTILDATSGNTGIAYAMIGAARGYKVTLCLPSNASVERKRILRIYGAEIIETDAMNGTDGAQIKAKELVKKFPDQYFYADQYNNEANWKTHFDQGAPEIWQQIGGRITHFIAGLGTSGTFVGTTRRLKEFNRNIQAISMQPDSPLHGLEGMKHMETAIVPGIYDANLADENVTVATEDAQEMTRRLAKEEGLLVGISAGANVFAAIRLAKTLKKDAVIVTVLCDGGGKYLSEKFWDED